MRRKTKGGGTGAALIFDGEQGRVAAHRVCPVNVGADYYHARHLVAEVNAGDVFKLRQRVKRLPLAGREVVGASAGDGPIALPGRYQIEDRLRQMSVGTNLRGATGGAGCTLGSVSP